MNYEKEYKEALERAAAIHNETVVPTPSTKGACEYIFHELAESEDEKIREELIEYFEWNAQQILNNFDNKDVIAWLEKQGKNDMGISEATKQKLEDSLNKALEKETPESWNKILDEQNPTDKFEPKFNVGDWLVCCNYEPEQIVGIRNDMYEMSNGDIRPIKMINKNHNIRLWTIQDVRVGDVLAWDDSNCIAMFKEIYHNDSFKSYGFVGACSGMFENGAFHDIEDVHPATKEQRDLLFSKMKEAGYEWDAEKKELKKIEQTPAAYFYCKYVGTTPKCGDCVRNHLNSKYKIEDIKTWMTPASRGTKQCSDYVPKDSVK